ncbi:MAG TPA: glycosyltransferase [Solirubrobacteraceae bacterium]|jgi:glycosyltransferase involved in cell wall biosynthesis|nr:glycosyltransferase [Solirubrobacteraceae bacterium]
MVPDTLIILTAHDEADRIEGTLRALARAFPGAPVWVADDGSRDETARIARQAGARVVASRRSIGKGGAATLAARDALSHLTGERKITSGEGALTDVVSAPGTLTVVVLCDGDLGESAALLAPLADAVREQGAGLAVAAFARRVGGGLGLTVGFARWAIRRRCALELQAPISGQRALPACVLADVLPFAAGFGMEVGMTIDAARAGHRVVEIELDLQHRATGRTPSGFGHRGKQLLDCLRAYLTRR